MEEQLQAIRRVRIELTLHSSALGHHLGAIVICGSARASRGLIIDPAVAAAGLLTAQEHVHYCDRAARPSSAMARERRPASRKAPPVVHSAARPGTAKTGVGGSAVDGDHGSGLVRTNMGVSPRSAVASPAATRSGSKATTTPGTGTVLALVPAPLVSEKSGIGGASPGRGRSATLSSSTTATGGNPGTGGTRRSTKAAAAASAAEALKQKKKVAAPTTTTRPATRASRNDAKDATGGRADVCNKPRLAATRSRGQERPRAALQTAGAAAAADKRRRQARSGGSGGIVEPALTSQRSKSRSTTVPNIVRRQPTMVFFNSSRTPVQKASPKRKREVERALHRAALPEDDPDLDQLSDASSSVQDRSTTSSSGFETPSEGSDSDPFSPLTPLSDVEVEREEEPEPCCSDQPDDLEIDDHAFAKAVTTSSPKSLALRSVIVSPRSRPAPTTPPLARLPRVAFTRGAPLGRSAPRPPLRPRLRVVTLVRPPPTATPMPRRAVNIRAPDVRCDTRRPMVSAMGSDFGTVRGGPPPKLPVLRGQRIVFDSVSDVDDPGFSKRHPQFMLVPDPELVAEIPPGTAARPSHRLAASHQEGLVSSRSVDDLAPPPYGLHAAPTQFIPVREIEPIHALNAVGNYQDGSAAAAAMPPNTFAASSAGVGGCGMSAMECYPSLYNPPGGACPVGVSGQTTQVYMVGTAARGGNGQILPPANPYIHPGVSICTTNGQVNGSSALAPPPPPLPPLPPLPIAPNYVPRKGKEARLEKYDPAEAFEVYFQRFALAADYNGWDDVERAAQLAFVLGPTEFATIRHLQLRAPGSYALAVAALTQQYGASNNRIRSLAIFRARRQQPSETLMAFSQTLKGLAEFAYPHLDAMGREGLAIDQFVRNVADHATSRLLLQDTTLRTLTEAVNKAVTIESAETEANLHKPRAQPNPRYDRYPHVMAIGREDDGTRAELAQLSRQVGELRQDMRVRIPSESEPASPRTQPRTRAFTTAMTARERVDIICFRCGVPGHLARACPDRRQDSDHRDHDPDEKRSRTDSYQGTSSGAGNDQRAATLVADMARPASPPHRGGP